MTENSRHLKVRIDEPLSAALGRLARRRGHSISDSVRGAIFAQVQAEEGPGPTLQTLHAGVLAALLAAELGVQLLTRLVPGGERQVSESTEDAAEQARLRLDEVERILGAEEANWRH